MSTTYPALVANIKATSGRTDPQTINAIPQFINAAQSKLDSLLRIGAMIATVTYNTDETSVDASEFLTIQSVEIDGLVGTSTTFSDITGLRAFVAARPEAEGYSFHYAMHGNNIELVRPNTVTVTGFQKPPRISAAIPTNAYTDGADNALLWLSLFYLGVFARDEMANNWQEMANEEITSLNNTYDQFAKTGTAKVKRRGYF